MIGLCTAHGHRQMESGEPQGQKTVPHTRGPHKHRRRCDQASPKSQHQVGDRHESNVTWLGAQHIVNSTTQLLNINCNKITFLRDLYSGCALALDQLLVHDRLLWFRTKPVNLQRGADLYPVAGPYGI